MVNTPEMSGLSDKEILIDIKERLNDFDKRAAAEKKELKERRDELEARIKQREVELFKRKICCAHNRVTRLMQEILPTLDLPKEEETIFREFLVSRIKDLAAKM